MCECSAMGPVIVIGDVNVHLGKEYGPRGWGKTTSNGVKLMQVMMRCGMKIRDLQDDCRGPTYTYSFSQGKSYIDHCFISDDHCHLASCNVLHDDIHNVSDHLALSVKLKVPLPTAIDLSVRVQVAWHKMTSCEIEQLYTKPLEENMWRTY